MHQFEAYKNELIKASSTVPTPDIQQSFDGSNNKRGAAMVSRKRESPPATMVTPTSSLKRQKQQSPDIPTSSVDQLTSKGNNVPSPVRSSNTSTATTSAMKATPVSLPKYEERTKVGHVVASYPAGHVSEKSTETSDSKQRRCVLTTKCVGVENGNIMEDDDVTRYNIKESYRHMFTTLEDRANALERHLVRTKTAIVVDIEKERMNKKIKNGAGGDVEASFEEVNVPRQHPSTFVGRICNEAHNGRMNSTSVVLEGSSSSCGGARVNVDLSHMQKKEQEQNGYSLFPGQIVAIEGINGTGRKITATKIKEGALLLPASSSIESIEKYYGDDDEQAQPVVPLKVISACGPFTTARSMDYIPFLDLMHVVLEENPDVVILTGPFVDVRQEIIKSGRVTCEEEGEEHDIVVDYESLFSQRIAAVIEEVFEDKSLVTEFILVPALEDATAKFV